MKNHYNYVAAKETVEQEFEKDLYMMRQMMRNMGMNESHINDEITKIIDMKIDLSFIEINGELRKKK